jgi:hypothetical protein
MELIDIGADMIDYICKQLDIRSLARFTSSCSQLYKFYPYALRTHKLLMTPVLKNLIAIEYRISDNNKIKNIGRYYCDDDPYCVSFRRRGDIMITYSGYQNKLIVHFEDINDGQNCSLIELFPTELDEDMWYNEYCGQMSYDDCRRRFPGSVKITIRRDVMNSLDLEYDEACYEFNAWCLPKWADDWNADA